MIRVLVVHEADAEGKALAEMLEAAGFHVTEALDAETALAHAGRATFDIVVLDQVPQVSRALRQVLHAARPDLPVVVVTDDPNLIGTWAAADLGATGHVAKPVRALLLLDAIRDALVPRKA